MELCPDPMWNKLVQHAPHVLLEARLLPCDTFVSSESCVPPVQLYTSQKEYNKNDHSSQKTNKSKMEQLSHQGSGGMG